jgi:RNA polymerase sigma factor for flagellar operon FliA
MPANNPGDTLQIAAPDLPGRQPATAAPARSIAAAMPENARAAAQYHAVDGRTLEESEIIRLHAVTVKRIALRLQARLPDEVQFDDLLQAGFIAVLRAVRRGSVTPDGIPPLVLQRIISNAMIDEARGQTWAPVRTVRLAKAANRAMRATKQRLGRDGTDEEVAQAMNLQINDYHSLLTEIAGIRLLDVAAFGEGAQQLRAEDNQHAALDNRRMMAALTAAITALPEREKTVVSLYYEHELNMDEIGEVLGVAKSTVSRIHGRALLILRGALGDWAADAGEPDTPEAAQVPNSPPAADRRGE